MKITLLTLLLSTITFFNHVQAQVQEWQSIASFPGDGRTSAVQFVIGDTAYVGLGVERDTYNYYKKDFYKYDIQNDLWTPISDFPGAARSSAVAFVVNGKAYVGTGGDDSNSYADFYKYDPNTGSWESVASMPNVRSSASSFVINNKGYVGLGSGSSGQLSDFYKYDDHNDQWVSISGVGDEFKRTGAIGFNVNGKGYISSGVEYSSGTFNYQDILSYDPTTDTWTEELGYDINLSSLMDNTVYVDENNLVHVLKAASTNKEVIIDVTDFSVSSEEYYFTDDRDDPIVFQINGEVISGLGATGNIFDPIYQNSFKKLVTIAPPAAPTIYDYNFSGVLNVQTGEEYDINYILWENNEQDRYDGNIIYLKVGEEGNYSIIDTVGSFSTRYRFRTENLEPNTLYYVKIDAYRGVAKSTSNEFSFLSIIADSKINTPSILNVGVTSDFYERELEIVNYDLTEKLIIEKSLNDQDFQPIDSSNFISTLETKKIKFNDSTYPINAAVNSIKYRVRLYDNDSLRPPSDYSNEIELVINDLYPYVGNLELTNIETYNSYGYINYSVDSLLNVEYAVLQHKDISDFAFANDTSYYSNIRLEYDYEYDSIEARVIVSNALGLDTSNIVSVITPLYPINNLKANYASKNTIGISFSNGSNKLQGSVVERAINSGEFTIYDTIQGKSYSYYDENIEEGNEYHYRIYNYGEGPNSKKSSEVSINANNMGVWKKFNEDGLKSVIDSIGKYSMQYKFIEDGNIYFLSLSQQKLYSYSLTDYTLTKLQDFPNQTIVSINEAILHNGFIYCFEGKDQNYKSLPSIFRYDISQNKWDTSISNPFENHSVNYAYGVNDVLYVMMRNDNYKYTIAEYDITNQLWSKNDYDMYNINTTYATHTPDSLIIFDYNNGRIAYDFETKEINYEDAYIANNLIRKGVVNYNDELLYISGKSIDNVNLNERPFRYQQELLNVNQFNNGYAFTFDGKLLYGLSFGNSNGYNYELGIWYDDTDLLYYRDDNAPLEAAGFKADSIGIEGAKLSWFDSPNDNGYIIEIGDYDSTIVIDTLPKDHKFFTIEGLKQRTFYEAFLTAINGENAGVRIRTSFRTKQGVPNRPTGFTSKAISSSEILYTWDPIDTTNIPVDSLIFNDVNAEKYILNISDTSFLYSGLDENYDPAVDLYVKNKYGTASAWWSNRARTYLNSPIIKKVNIHETAGYYEIVFEDKSQAENYYNIYRKSQADTAFVKVDSISTKEFSLEVEPILYQDLGAELNKQYDYYILAEYKGKWEYEDTTEYYSYFALPSDTASTTNAVLSVNPYLDSEISIYPNPANEFVIFSLGENIILKQIQVLNVNGKFVKTVKSNDRIDLSNLAPGLYFVRFRTNQGETTKKLIKR